MNTLTCERCGGSGKVGLPERLKTTLKLIPRKRDHSITAYDLHLMDWSSSTSCYSNNLKSLLDLGLVERKKRGRFWLYSRAQPKTK